MTSVRPRRDPLSVDSAFAPILASAKSGSGTSFEELYHWLAPAVAGYFRAQGERDAEDLSVKNQAGTISEAELRRLDTYIHVGDLLGLLQAEARSALQRQAQST